ncbi:MAG: adenylate/guanylate cyclase domain-containing protein, partial [Usitatibacter sp.]
MSEGSRAVFISYTLQDAEAARRVSEALRAAGLEVWFDQSELRGGDAWDTSIRKQIRECALFVPVISANTNARSEGYFRLEWKLGADRSHLMADDQAFLLPIIIDDTAEALARVPDRFRERQWSRVVDAVSAAGFASRVNEILARAVASHPKVERRDGAKTEERRVVTVLFSDVAGSTAMGESSDPEDVRALLDRYYAIASRVVAAHGGTLEKVMGDSVMAVFGIPQAHGDDAERALVAALALLDALARDPQTATLTLSIGVNTGEVVAARSPDAGAFVVTGDTVNIAARLQQHADPGAILVGERTRRAVSGFGFGTVQELAVKGKREPIGA